MSNDNKTLADVQPGGRVRLPQSDLNLISDFAALPAQPSQPSSLGLEAMLAACVPGGDMADPQVIADNIRHWFAAQPSPGGQDSTVSDDMVQAFKAALARAQLPGKSRTYFLKDSELPSILREVLAARQPEVK